MCLSLLEPAGLPGAVRHAQVQPDRRGDGRPVQEQPGGHRLGEEHHEVQVPNELNSIQLCLWQKFIFPSSVCTRILWPSPSQNAT